MFLGASGWAREILLVAENCKHENFRFGLVAQNFDYEHLFFLVDDKELYGKTLGQINGDRRFCNYHKSGIIIGSIENPFNSESGSFYSLMRDFPELNSFIHEFFPAVGSPKLKMDFVNRIEKAQENWKPYTCALIHNRSFVGDLMGIGQCSVICSNCSITTNVSIGKYVNVNLNCTIGHDAVIEDYVNLSPHCTISGHCHIKKGADLGSAVTVLPGITIGENSVIGAGAVVTKDVPDNVLVVAKGAKGEIIKELK
jgi:sugar O-acyltransferase (sialic acid O-acetyltransferase NeuD family)